MPNSTIGKNEILLLLFTFILYSGSFSAYGQECPVVTDQDSSLSGNQQYFCNSSRFQVQDLLASGTNVAWYSEEDATSPLSPTEILVHGEEYFAGLLGGSCESRSSVLVSIYQAPEILGIYGRRSRNTTKQSLPILYFCVDEIEDSEIFLSEVRTNADDSGRVQWYSSQTTTTALDPSATELINGETYWVDQGSPDGSCRSTRRSVLIELVSEPAPTGPSTQIFCAADNPTLSDIEATGTNRYYPEPASGAELGADTPLVNGRTYYISAQGAICESGERLPVTVNLSQGIEEETQGFCANIGLGNEFGRPSVANLAPQGSTWYAEEDSATPLDADELLVDNEDYFLGNITGSCGIVRVTVDIYETPNAGGTSIIEDICINDAPFNLFERIEPSQLPIPISENGTFSPTLPNNIFDPQAFGPGVHAFEYTAPATENCPADTSIIRVTVLGAPETSDMSFCASEAATVADLIATGTSIQWYTDAELTIPANETDILVEGSYYATQIVGNDCETQAASITVSFTDTPTPTLIPGGNVFCETTSPSIGDLSSNIAEDGSIAWYSDATGNNILSESESLQNGTTYYASLTDATSDCESSGRLPVTVTLEACAVNLPEAFSPNGDGINDRFEMENMAIAYPNFSIEIYNRWGNRVFRGNASSPAWDGTSQGSRTIGDKELPVGVYFYILNYNDGQTAPIQGSLYLSR